MTKRRLKEKLSREFGRRPDLHYYDGDLGRVRRYFDYRWDEGLDEFLVDDITAGDLNINGVFMRLNACRSTSGEQYLYYMLRSPCVRRERYDKRSRLIRYAEQNPDRRLELQTTLHRLGRNRQADVSEVFNPRESGPGLLIIYILMVVLLLASGAVFLVTRAAGTLWPFIAMFIINATVHGRRQSRHETQLATVNYSVGMIFAATRVRACLNGELDEQFSPMYLAADKLKTLLKIGGVSLEPTGTIADMINSVLLLDLISYEYLKNKLWRSHGDIFTIHEHLGMLDAAIAVASYRQGNSFCEPELDFAPDAARRLEATGLVHPLLDSAVPNPLCTTEPILITGSNASGKSTYLKTVALAAIMAQGICTCPAESYSACVFRIFSSMAISDDLLAGESYYISEIKSLKRVVDYLENGSNTLCVIDEVLRGTNTVERIAASCELLTALSLSNCLCIAATHDLELCSLLSSTYRPAHFEEQVEDGEMSFDYRLRQGPATGRNAIKLLGIMGFDDGLVERAEARAVAYIQSGTW